MNSCRGRAAPCGAARPSRGRRGVGRLVGLARLADHDLGAVERQIVEADAKTFADGVRSDAPDRLPVAALRAALGHGIDAMAGSRGGLPHVVVLSSCRRSPAQCAASWGSRPARDGGSFKDCWTHRAGARSCTRHSEEEARKRATLKGTRTGKPPQTEAADAGTHDRKEQHHSNGAVSLDERQWPGTASGTAWHRQDQRRRRAL